MCFKWFVSLEHPHRWVSRMRSILNSKIATSRSSGPPPLSLFSTSGSQLWFKSPRYLTPRVPQRIFQWFASLHYPHRWASRVRLNLIPKTADTSLLKCPSLSPFSTNSHQVHNRFQQLGHCLFNTTFYFPLEMLFATLCGHHGWTLASRLGRQHLSGEPPWTQWLLPSS